MNSGVTLGLLGPNGAGKTTLFYMIVVLLKKDSGLIKLESKDISNKNNKITRPIILCHNLHIRLNECQGYFTNRQII